MQAKRAELMQSLQLANALGARDQAASLQLQISQMDNAFRYASLAQQGSQFGQSLGQQESQFGRSLGYNYAQLGQNQGQWNDTYGLNRLQLQSQLDRQALLAGMQ